MRIAVAGGTGAVGRYAAQAVADAGHEVVVLARSKGVDTSTGEGLAQALAGVQTIIDATNAGTIEQDPATDFFRASTTNLEQVGRQAGVQHLVVLSIVGIDSVPMGYYAAKLAHEQAAIDGRLPVTILRATQFYEFAGQMIAWSREGSTARIPNFHVQPVAARTVGQVLAELAGDTPRGRVRDLAGPEQADLATLAQRLSDYLHLGVEVEAVDSGVPAEALIAGGSARIEGPTFEQWLTSGDADDITPLR